MVSSSELIVALSLAVSGGAVLTYCVRQAAMRSGLIDHPNHRSAHSRPTPRGGGLAIALVSTIAMAVAAFRDGRGPLLALALAGASVAVVSFIDDRRGLSARTRLAVHLAAALLLVWCTGAIDLVPFVDDAESLSQLSLPLTVVAIAWHTNLFNFMDGLDGFAAVQAFFVSLAFSAFAYPSPISLAAIGIAGASAGFLFFNWSPATIFMGDVGSAFLGFSLAGIGLVLVRNDAATVWVVLILTAGFWVDATLTLCIRALRGERLSEAHSQHAYQHAARRFKSHRRVSLILIAIDVAWLLPLAVIAARVPALGPALTALGALPLATLALSAGCGRPAQRANHAATTERPGLG